MRVHWRSRIVVPASDHAHGEPAASLTRPGQLACTVMIDGRPQRVPAGVTVAAALEIAGCGEARRSVTGERRQAFCGMGMCGECRVTIDGRAHRLACQTPCTPGMEIRRDA